MKKEIEENTEYPSNEDLEIIEKWDILKQGKKPLVNFILSLWHFEDFAILKGNRLQLHTGGWNGNEDIINSLKRNLFWNVCWRKSTCGGHYWFNVKELKLRCQDEKKTEFKEVNMELPCRFKWGICRYNSMLLCIAETNEDCKLYRNYNPTEEVNDEKIK